MHNINVLRQQRLERMQKAVRYQEKPDRVPNLSYFVTWPFFDAGYTLKEAVCDYDKIERAISKHCTDYDWDGIYCYGTRNPYRVTQRFGTEYYQITDEAINIGAYQLLTHEELKELADDPMKTIWTRCMPRKFPAFCKDMPLKTMQSVADERLLFNQFSAKMGKKVREEFGYPDLQDNSLGFMYFGYEYLFSMTRGIRGFSTDMRQDPALLKQAAQALDQLWAEPSLKRLENSAPGHCPTSVWDVQICLLAPTVMNRRQYEYFYVPILRRICDACARKGKNIRIMYEGDTERFLPYYTDYPKGMITFMVEQDDLFKLKREYPQFSWCGGMPVSLLGNGTQKQVVDYARRLVNEVGGDGGFVISLDKMASFRTDATRENVKAYCDFIAQGQY